MIPAVPPKQAKFTLNSVQALRGVAALLVVSTHVETALRENGLTAIPWPSRAGGLSGFGGVGVDIFFVISGFIMVYVGARYFRREGTVQDFLIRRVLRIYPLYWLVTLLLVAAASAKTLLALRAGQPLAQALDFDLQWHRLLGGLTLFPTYNEFGNIQPIVGIGWTLSYEVFFYFVFALTLGIGFRWSVFAVIGVFVFLIVVPLPWDNSTFGTFLKDGILLEFPAGMLIGYAALLGSRPPRWVVATSLVLALAGYLISILFQFDYEYHYLHRGIPSALLVFGLVFWEIRYGLNVHRLLVWFGDASYSVYLIHTVVISYLFMPVIRAAPSVQNFQVDVLGFVMFVTAALLGLLLYEKIEKPMQRLLMKRYDALTGLNLARETITQPKN
jgi:peptidoglycan/LPS O-acetylase OafA/YrhL